MISKLYFALFAVSMLAMLAVGCGEVDEKTETPADELAADMNEVVDETVDAEVAPVFESL